jgi:heat shock protein HslJ
MRCRAERVQVHSLSLACQTRVLEPRRAWPHHRCMRKLCVAVACFLAGLALWGCGPEVSAEGAGAGAANLPENRTFLSSSVTEGTKDRPLVAGTHISLRFDYGRMRAKAGCNILAGDARVEDGRLVLGEMLGTLMRCDPARLDQDTWLSDFLESRPTLRLTDDELVLRTDAVKIRLTDRDAVDPDRALLNTMWDVETIITGGATSSIPDDAQAFLGITMAGHVSGATGGCAPLSGRLEVGAASIVFPPALPPALPLPDCSGPRIVLDQAVRAALRGEVAFSLEAHSLTLRGPDGHGLVLRET